MPKEAEISVVEANFLYQSFAEEIGLVFGEVHIILITQCAVHNCQRVQREIRQFHGLWVDPTNGTCGLQAETCLVGKAHGEVICITVIGELLQLVDGATQIVRAMECADWLRR